MEISRSNMNNDKLIIFNRFKEYFRDDLIGYIKKPKQKPHFKVITSGGYGLKTLLEIKHQIYGKVITDDMDFTISTHNTYLTSIECYNYWHKKITEFINRQDEPSYFSIQTINLKHEYIPVMKFHRDFVIIIKYKEHEFIDIAITDLNINNHMLDTKASLLAGIPLKKEQYYLKEFLSLIYMENVTGVNPYCYYKRNPVTGKLPCKGLKDIDRVQLLCSINKIKLYKVYCKLIMNISFDRLKSMEKRERNKYFKELKKIL